MRTALTTFMPMALRILCAVSVGMVLLTSAQGMGQLEATDSTNGPVAVAENASQLERGWPRGLVALSVGVPLRLRRDRRSGQGRLGPRYGDLTLGGLLSSRDNSVQHGAGIGLSLGLSDEGRFFEPIEPFDQYSIAPTYLVMLQVNEDWFSLGHVAVPVAFGSGMSVGLDVGVAGAYRVLAGLAIFVELSAVTFLGGELRPYPTLAAELGIVVDYEVLP